MPAFHKKAPSPYGGIEAPVIVSRGAGALSPHLPSWNTYEAAQSRLSLERFFQRLLVDETPSNPCHTVRPTAILDGTRINLDTALRLACPFPPRNQIKSLNSAPKLSSTAFLAFLLSFLTHIGSPITAPDKCY